MARFIKKLSDYLSSREPSEDLTDDINILEDFIKNNSDKLSDYVEYVGEIDNSKSELVNTFDKYHQSLISEIKYFKNLFKFNININIIKDINDRIEIIDIESGDVYLKFYSGSLYIYTRLKLSGLDDYQVKLNNDHMFNKVILKDNYIHLFSKFNSNFSDFSSYLEEYFIRYLRSIVNFDDSYLITLRQYLNYEARVKEIQSKIDDIKDILMDLIDLSSEHNIIKNQAGGISVFITIPSLVTTNITQGDGYSIELNKTSTDIFDILLEVRPRIEDLIGECDINVEFRLGKINLFINAKREH
jgi:hypothetical protein